MFGTKNQEAMGIFLVVLGVIFLLVSNNLLWFGWETIWPVLPFLGGLFLLRLFATRKSAAQLFWGLLLCQLGIFVFLFTSGALGWERMSVLWPGFFLAFGVALMATIGVSERSVSPLLVGLFAIIFAVVSFLSATGVIQSRVSQPLARFWPLVLVGAGVLIYLRGRGERDQSPVENSTD